MAIGTINEIVYSRLPWLINPDDDVKVSTYVCQVQWTLQPYLNKPDSDVENELTYSNREKLLTGLYAAYNLVDEKIIENTAGKNGQKPTGNKFVKKAKADVTEVEFATPKADDGGVLIATAQQISDKLKSEICALAATMSIKLPLCSNGVASTPSDVGAVGIVFSCGLNSCC